MPAAGRAPREHPSRRLAAALVLGTVLLAGCEAGGIDGVYDLDGNALDPLAADTPVVAIFVDTHCPISNRYAPTIERLYTRYRDRVPFWLVYPNRALDAPAIRAHRTAFGLSAPVARDPDHRFVAHTGVKVTPEAAVFDADGRLRYRGRIDDRFVDFNRQRPRAGRHDLASALDAVLAGHEVPPLADDAVSGTSVERPGIGCFIADLK